MHRRAELLFKDVRHTLQDLSKKIAVGSEDGSMKTAEARVHISELEGMQQKDEVEFEVAISMLQNLSHSLLLNAHLSWSNTLTNPFIYIQVDF